MTSDCTEMNTLQCENNSSNICNNPKHSPKWIESLNISWSKQFIQSEAGVAKRTGQDILAMNKFDSFNIFVFEQLNRIIIKQYFENKRRMEYSPDKRPKKNLIPFI